MKEAQRPNHDDFRDEFKKSRQWPKLLKRTRIFLAKNPNRPDEQFIQDFTGKLFEQLAYLKHRETFSSPDILLDPYATEDFFKGLYRRNPAPKSGQTEFGSEYIPDGIILRPTPEGNEVVKILEYSTVKENKMRKRYIVKKTRRFSLLVEYYPYTFRLASLEIIFPSDSSFSNDFISKLDEKVSIGFAPYSNDSTHQFATELAAAHFGIEVEEPALAE